MTYNSFFNPYQGQAQQQANGLIAIQSEMEARSYPVAPGNTLLFKHQTEPYLYTKSMGYSLMEPPQFEVYRRVDENAQNATEATFIAEAKPCCSEELKADLEALRERIEALEKPKRTAKKEVVIDE